MKGRPASKTRAIGYRFEGDWDPATDLRLEKVLNAALASGCVTEWDTDHHMVIWFNGTPGKQLRAIRDQVEKLVNGRTI